MPTYAIIDSQSVKIASSAHDKGFDGGKKIKGRKRHISEQLGLTVEISKKIQDISWHILPKRWIVERTFAWLGWSGRLAKDFEQTNLSAENFVKLGYISQILKFIK
ncbi:hypothetical protein QDY71_09880 [Kingella negevensis]|uniref:Transposase DDE domain protein n=1 Tax=Kingella negevensis TaxID=1522312 RepID=A0A238HGK7_9NEIS|nr:hypothetical protein [Kingella negevensis]MDK4698049.1 hypothetical protein [Kingella negevensis]